MAGRGVTDTRAVPDLPSDVAVIVTGPPSDTPSTIPVLVTATIEGALDCQKMSRSDSGSSLASYVVAVSSLDPPTTTPA